MATYDSTTGKITTNLEELIELGIEWHIDEATSTFGRDGAAVYARRFVLRLLGIDAMAAARALTGIEHPADLEDVERDAIDLLMRNLPRPMVDRIVRLEDEPADDEDDD